MANSVNSISVCSSFDLVTELLTNADALLLDGTVTKAVLVTDDGGRLEFPLLLLAVASPLLADAASEHSRFSEVFIHLPGFTLDTVCWLKRLLQGEQIKVDTALVELCCVLGVPYDLTEPCSNVEVQLEVDAGGMSSASTTKGNIQGRPYSCDICPRRFTARSNMYRHRKQHSTPSNPEKRFSCELCHKNFISKQQLQIHIVTHTKERPYHCYICGKRYTARSNLYRHRKTHSTNVQPLDEPFTGQIFNSV